MSASLYARYIKERLGYGIIESDDGFISFCFPTDKIVYMVDSYVVPEKRNFFFLKSMADQICQAAAKEGKEFALASVDITAKNADRSAKVLKAYGMKEYKIVGSTIFFSKPIKEL